MGAGVLGTGQDDDGTVSHGRKVAYRRGAGNGVEGRRGVVSVRRNVPYCASQTPALAIEPNDDGGVYMSARKAFLAAAVAALAVTSVVSAQPAAQPAAEEYEFSFLDEIEGERALAWARQENERTLGELTADPRYQRFHDRALQILQARDRIPFVSFRPDGLHNFWQDENHVRGIWRRTSMASYRTQNPQWETILDVDALARAENANWVYRGANCLPPQETRCLVVLSDGGKDAAEYREFDTSTRQFVEGGFRLPVGKQSATWVDENTLLVAREWGPGTMTASGYPFVVKRLRRGQSIDQAEEVFRATPQDMQAGGFVLRDAAGRVQGVGFVRATTIFDAEYHMYVGDRLVKLNLPSKANLAGIVDGRVLVSLDQDWEAVPGLRFKADSVISYDLEAFKRNPNAARPSLVWEPGPRQTLSSIATTRDALIVTTLDNVRGRAVEMNYANGRWTSRPIRLPANATIGVAAASDESNEALFTVTDYLTPTALWYYNGDRGALETLKTTPARFNAATHMVEQFEATSRDGTKVPYFLVRPRNMRMDGSTPTLLYGYGGFQVSQVPNYNANMGALWLEQGNAYVVANLRGGGEFGPTWHQTAQLANKQRTWDDYIAVAEDLIRRRITSPRRLGGVGGSQGGLLVGTAITQRPELFNAAIVQVPLFDMLRYHTMSAGASWIGEYGDPRIPEQRAWIEGYSPYQRLTPGRTYPTPFILTSTKDDRVHPGHGRRAAARLQQLGQPYYYYENIDGGHSAAANLRESARRLALEYTYASKRLVDGDTSGAPAGERGR
jgi:prolyl oligopeptidase